MKDSCPECGSTVWPAVNSRSLSRLWINFRYCNCCGYDLCSEKRAPSDIVYKDIPPTEFSCLHEDRFPLDYEMLWGMAQLVIRKRSFALRTALTEHGVLGIERLDDTASTIEQLPIEARAQVLGATKWLVDEWPTRFLAIASQANLSAEHFSGAHQTFTENVMQIVNLNLRRRITKSREEINQTISRLATSGKAMNKSRIRAELGISESVLLNQILSQRRHASCEEFLKLVKIFERNINLASPARKSRISLIRNLLIVLASAFARRQVDDICALSVTNFMELIALAAANKHQVERDLAAKALLLDAQIPKVPCGELRFYSRFGKPLMAHGIRASVSKIMKEEFDEKLWRSVDVFRFSLPE